MSNWLDKTIGWFSPQAALRRARQRSTANALLAYDGAKSGRRTDGWITSNADANTEIGIALPKLRDRSHELVRNSPHAAKAILEVEKTAIGYGITPVARTGTEALDKRINDLFTRWVTECDADGQLDFYGLQSLWARSIPESGSVIVRLRPRLATDQVSVPLQLQTLEPDFIDLSKNGSVGTSYIMQGIQFSQIGAREGYWLYSQHPGMNSAIFPTNPGLTSHFVPIESALMAFRPERPGQIHGVPWLASSMMKLRDLADYDEAELVRKKIESCVAAFVTQPDGMDGPSIAPPSTALSGQRVETFAPGMVEYLRPGESISFNNPTQSPGYREYCKTQLEAISTGIGIPYVLLSGDLSAVNYSSFRAGMIGWRRIMTSYQWHVLIPMLLQPIWERFIDAAIAAGELPVNTPKTVEWNPPKFETVDPLKDAQADLIEVRSGKKTLFQLIAEQGYDPIKQLTQIAQTNTLLDSLGLVLDTDPRKIARQTGAEQAGNNEQKQGN